MLALVVMIGIVMGLGRFTRVLESTRSTSSRPSKIGIVDGRELEVPGDGALLVEVRTDDAGIDAVIGALVHVPAVVAEQGHLAVLELEADASAAAAVRLELEDGVPRPKLLGEVDAELCVGEGRLKLRAREGGERERSADMNGGLHGDLGL